MIKFDGTLCTNHLNPYLPLCCILIYLVAISWLQICHNCVSYHLDHTYLHHIKLIIAHFQFTIVLFVQNSEGGKGLISRVVCSARCLQLKTKHPLWCWRWHIIITIIFQNNILIPVATAWLIFFLIMEIQLYEEIFL